MINTTGLQSNLQSALNQIETLCKTYNPDTDNLSSFQTNVKSSYASLLASYHTQHVLTASVQTWAVAGVTAGAALVPQVTPLTLT